MDNAIRQWLINKKIGLHHRQLVTIDLPLQEQTDVLNIVHEYYKNIRFFTSSSQSFGNLSPQPNFINPSHYKRYLGNQIDALIFDANNGIDLNALYASAGAVCAGGLIIIILDSQLKSNRFSAIKFSFGQTPIKSYFYDVFIKKATAREHAAINRVSYQLPSCLINNQLQKPHAKLTQNIQTLALSTQQENALFSISEQILGALQAEHETVCIILGERGRGKSSLLGVIAAHLQNQIAIISPYKPLNIVTTAPHYRQLEMCNKVFKERLSQEGNLNQVNLNTKDLPFYAPDQICELAHSENIILIDEVASIAPELIKKIIKKFDHIVLTGTTNGYEGSGNGFIKRLMPFIQNTYNTQCHVLSTPFRWHQNDPVETFFDDILCKQESPVSNIVPQSTSLVLNIKHINKTNLVDDSYLFNQVFNLLQEAHYQTTPNDIQRILDSPDCIIIGVTPLVTNKQLNTQELPLLGILVLFEEGGEVLDEIANNISTGKRRVQGHLSPQSLALHTLDSSYCTKKYLRINRIAVNSQYQNRGIGSALLNFCSDYAKTKAFDALSTSFGFTIELYRFWNRNGFLLAKLGNRIDTASGTASVLLLKSCCTQSQIINDTIQVRIHLDLACFINEQAKLKHIYKDLVNEVNKTNVDFSNTLKVITRFVSYYTKGLIDYKKCKSFVYYLIDSNKSSENYPMLIKQFEKLNQKGLHKDLKQDLEIILMNKIIKLM